MRSAGQVSADLPRHVSSWTPAAYEQSKGFHEKEKEKEKEEAEYERRMQILNRRVRDDIPLSPTEYAAWRRWSGLPPLPSSSAGKRRKRKKRRKRRLPRSPRPLLLGRTRRRQRQWSACNAGFTGYDAPRVMSPMMLRILAGMDQKDRCSGIYMAGIACGNAPFAVFSSLVRRPFPGPMVQTVQNPVEFTQVQLRDEVVFMPVVVQGLALGIDSAETCCSTGSQSLWMVGPSLPLQLSFLVLFVGSLLRGCLRCDVVWWWFFTPDGSYDSVWDSVMPMTGKFFNYFQYQEFVGSVCMLNFGFSSNDDICPYNYNFSRFKLKDKCRSEKWELYLYGDMTIMPFVVPTGHGVQTCRKLRISPQLQFFFVV